MAAGCSLTFFAAGCGTDYEAEVDAKVTQEWMREGKQVDALEYFKTGGRYYSGAGMPGKPDLDQEAIVPFLKDLKEKFGQEQYAIQFEGDEYAWGIVMKLPVDKDNRRRFEEYLEEVRESFPGMILEEWGHEWISFDFLDKEEAEFIRESEAASEAAS
ncbi:MAG: hypothetical protein AB7U20_18445 [Planctomycetaceae bacterium]